MASLRIQHCLLGILCLFPTLSIAGEIELYTDHKVVAVCGQTVELPCNVLAKDHADIDIKSLTWMMSKDYCDYTMTNQSGPGFKCQKLSYSKPVGRIYNYTLSIFNIQPKDQGTYHCKLRSKEGVANGKTIVRVQQCLGNSSYHVTSTEATCTFEDVYPAPIIHWTQGYNNYTNQQKLNVTVTPEGRFTAVSTIKLGTKKNPESICYHCSLFLVLENAENDNETEFYYMRSESFAGGHKLMGHWFGVMLAMVLGVLLA
ncbi:uncharacterized protein [Eucyclogobius newberryi]|uniref:uncharacterized protein n=1 Tax=Eucyclogobius newberryi TaxID=166745 RepID=UPI003B5B49C7